MRITEKGIQTGYRPNGHGEPPLKRKGKVKDFRVPMIKKVKAEKGFHYQFNVPAASLSSRIYKEQGVDIKELQLLESIYLLNFDKEGVVSTIRREQELLLEKTGDIRDSGFRINRGDCIWSWSPSKMKVIVKTTWRLLRKNKIFL